MHFKLIPMNIEGIIQPVHYKFPLSSIAMDLHVAVFVDKVATQV
jgi:hypothetical protein